MGDTIIEVNGKLTSVEQFAKLLPVDKTQHRTRRVGRWVGLPMTLATHMRHDEDLPGTRRLKYFTHCGVKVLRT